jgi:hypothetical protein
MSGSKRVIDVKLLAEIVLKPAIFGGSRRLELPKIDGHLELAKLQTIARLQRIGPIRLQRRAV